MIGDKMKENNINFDFANAVELLALTEETGMSIAQVMLRRGSGFSESLRYSQISCIHTIS